MLSTVDTLQIHIKHLQTGLIKEESFLGELITILKKKRCGVWNGMF